MRHVDGERDDEARGRERETEADERTSLDETAGMALAVMEISRDNLPKNG